MKSAFFYLFLSVGLGLSALQQYTAYKQAEARAERLKKLEARVNEVYDAVSNKVIQAPR